jgi:hypothetical protein
LDWLVITTDLF